MSYRPKYINNGQEVVLPVDAETICGKSLDSANTLSDTDAVIPNSKLVKDYVDGNISDTEDTIYVNTSAINMLSSRVSKLEPTVTELESTVTSGVNNLSSRVSELESTVTSGRVTGSVEYSGNSSALGTLIENHPFIRFYYKTTSGSGQTLKEFQYNVMYVKSYFRKMDTYSVSFYYVDGGTLTEITKGTLYYEYFTK